MYELKETWASVPGVALTSSGLTGCYAIDVPAFYFVIWIPPLVFETILGLLMLYKAWRTHKDDSRSPLLNLLIRDSVLYFLTNVTVMLVNCLIWAIRPRIIVGVALSWTVAVPCALGSRLLLNMRERYYKEHTLLPARGVHTRE